MTDIALLGLGSMGGRMAQALLKAGLRLTVWNRTPERADAVVAAGATRAATPRAAAGAATLVLSVLTDDDASRDVWLDPDHGALHGLQPGAIAVESSTVTTGWIAELDEAVRQRNAVLLDAPVVGSRPKAEAGQLIFLVGGPADALRTATPALQAMGGAVHHAGDSGQGMALKLVVNALFSIQVAALAELLGVLRKAGMAPDRAAELLAQMPTASPAAKVAATLMLQGTHAPLFPIDLAEKDLRYAQALAASVDGVVPLVNTTRTVLETAQVTGFGELHLTGVARLYGG